jgi:hypothetical protein
MKTRNYAIAVAVAAAISLFGATAAHADDHRGVVLDRGHVEFNLGKDVHVSAAFGSPCLPRPAVVYVEDRCISEHERLERIRIERERLERIERERLALIEHERWEREHRFHDHDHGHDHDHWH